MGDGSQRGFADPVRDARMAFRAVMDALARPGTIMALDPALSPPSPVHASAGGAALALCDSDTPVWLDDACGKPVADWLRFQTGAPLTNEPDDAAFALVADSAAAPKLDRFAQGVQDYPDRSTTIFLQVASLRGGPVLLFSGPGVDGSASIAPVGLPADFVGQWADNRARFPRGVDVVLCAPDGVVGLPRSVSIAARED